MPSHMLGWVRHNSRMSKSMQQRAASNMRPALLPHNCQPALQRRHQKILEETPSPFVTPELRERLQSAAVRLGQLAKYRWAAWGAVACHNLDADPSACMLGTVPPSESLFCLPPRPCWANSSPSTRLRCSACVPLRPTMSLQLCGHCGVHCRRRDGRVLLPGSQHAPAGSRMRLARTTPCCLASASLSAHDHSSCMGV